MTELTVWICMFIPVLLIAGIQVNQDTKIRKALEAKQAVEVRVVVEKVVQRVVLTHKDDADIGHVYLIEAGGFHKIGITVNLTNRMRALQTSCMFNIRVVQTMTTRNRHDIERMLHKQYKSKKSPAMNEWFELTPEDVREVRDFMLANTLK